MPRRKRARAASDDSAGPRLRPRQSPPSTEAQTPVQTKKKRKGGKGGTEAQTPVQTKKKRKGVKGGKGGARGRGEDATPLQLTVPEAKAALADARARATATREREANSICGLRRENIIDGPRRRCGREIALAPRRAPRDPVQARLAQGRKWVIQRRFNVGVLEAISKREASTL